MWDVIKSSKKSHEEEAEAEDQKGCQHDIPRSNIPFSVVLAPLRNIYLFSFMRKLPLCKLR